MKFTRGIVVGLLLVGCGKPAPKQDPAPSPGSSAPAAAPVVAPAESASNVPSADAIEAFWKWFADNADKLHANTDLVATMNAISDEVEKVAHGVFAEIGVDGDTRTIVISADGNQDLFPTVQAIVAKKPTVKGWEIVAFRQRDQAGSPGTSLEMNGKKVDPGTAKVVAEQANGKLDITVYLPGYASEKDGNLGFVLLDHVVGEYDMETKIAGIDFAAIENAPPEAKPLSTLPALVDALR